MVAANGMFTIADGLQEQFESIPWVARGIARGEIVRVGTDNPDAVEEPAQGLSLKAATFIAENEYRINASDLRQALKDGDIPGYLGSRKYDIQESDLRAGLERMIEARSDEPEEDPEEDPPAETTETTPETTQESEE
jgi:hypothetical protein